MTISALHPAMPGALRPDANPGADLSSAPNRRVFHARSDQSEKSELRRRLPELLPALEARALRLTRDPALAQDTLQDAIERALRFEHQYEPNSNLRAWLLRILQTVFVSRCRSRRRELRAMQTLIGDPCATFLAEAGPSMLELSPNAARALGAIPGSFRQAIELVDLADLSYRDAAEMIGVPLGTVMSRLHRGRRLLALALGEAQGSSGTESAPPARVGGVADCKAEGASGAGEGATDEASTSVDLGPSAESAQSEIVLARMGRLRVSAAA